MKKLLFTLAIASLTAFAWAQKPARPLHLYVCCTTWQESETEFRALAYWGLAETKIDAASKIAEIFAREHPGKVPSTVDTTQIPDEMIATAYHSKPRTI